MVRGDGTNMSAHPPSLGRVRGNVYEAISFAHGDICGASFPAVILAPSFSSSTRADRDAEDETTMKTRAAVALEKGKPLASPAP